MIRPTILDCERIKALRLENKLSQDRLGAMIGVSQSMVRYIELGRNHNQLNLRTVAKLAEVLGADMRDLIRRDEATADATSDDIRVEALLADEGMPLAAQEIATAFGWTMLRTRAALRNLKGRLPSGGTELTQGGGGRWRLGPKRSLLSDEERERLARARLPRRGINRTEALVLREIAAGVPGRRWRRGITSSDRLALAGLLKLGLVSLNDEGAPVMRPHVERSLHLKQMPSQPVKLDESSLPWHTARAPRNDCAPRKARRSDSS